MTQNKIDWDNIPFIIPDVINMSSPNDQISIHKGEFVIKDGEKEYRVNGELYFDWLPSLCVRFKGKVELELSEIYNLHPVLGDNRRNDKLTIHVNGKEIENAVITSFPYPELKGIINSKTILGNKNDYVDEIKFCVPNLRDFNGCLVRAGDRENKSFHSNRLTFEDDDYIITLDKSIDFKQRSELLQEKGGFHILYNGSLVRKHENIVYSEVRDYINCFIVFLSFLNGVKSNFLFRKGFKDSIPVWEDYSTYYVEQYKSVASWSSDLHQEDFNSIWRSFRKIWVGNVDNKSFLTSIINWYNEANINAVTIEGSIILAQAGLELLYNWWIKKGKDPNYASEKISLILSKIKIDSNIPKTLENLYKYSNSIKKDHDAPFVLVGIRNALVHSDLGRRKKLRGIDTWTKFDALQLYIQYLELGILCILGYNGKYNNRCSDCFWKGEGIEPVPWIIKNL